MSGLQGMWLVAGRELREAFRGKAFWIVAGIVLLGSTAGMVLPEVLDDDGPTTYDVGLVEPSPTLTGTLQDVAEVVDVEIDANELPDRAAAERAVEDDDIDAAALAGEPPVIIVRSGEHDRLVAILQQTLQAEALTARLGDAGLSPEQAADVLATRSEEHTSELQ